MAMIGWCRIGKPHVVPHVVDVLNAVDMDAEAGWGEDALLTLSTGARCWTSTIDLAGEW
jgi:hypothetical protein